MEIDEHMHEVEDDAAMMPADADPRSYDPTQSAGTPAWQEAVARQRELNARLAANARLRRN